MNESERVREISPLWKLLYTLVATRAPNFKWFGAHKSFGTEAPLDSLI